MPVHFYHIVLHTPLGKKQGKAAIDVTDGQIRGEIHLLNKTAPIRGNVLEDGTCRINGVLSTLTQVLPYCAAGAITADLLKLTLTAGKRKYLLTGEAAQENEHRQE